MLLIFRHPWLSLSIALILVFMSCRKGFLNLDPLSSVNVSIDSEDKIAEVLTAAYPRASYFAFLEPRTDNVAQRVNGEHLSLNDAMFFWEDYDQDDLDAPLNYWNACYHGIAQVNQVLELLDDYPKTARVKALYGEAFMLRAYLSFMLVNIWAEPYGTTHSNKSLGIPYPTKPEKNALVNYSRSTVKEVYDKIEKDLKLGISLVNDLYYKHPKFHFNKKAAYAFASRFYLMKGEWDLVIQYADYVLGSDPNILLRKWQNPNNDNDENFIDDFFAFSTNDYTSISTPSNLLLTTTESRIKRNIAIERYGLTINVRNQINNQGISFCTKKAFGLLDPQSGNVFRLSDNPRMTDATYIPKFDELSLSYSATSRPRDIYVTNVLLSTDEVMLNRIEAYAMKQRYQECIESIRSYLTTKFGITISECDDNTMTTAELKDYDIYSPFYSLTIQQLGLIKIILILRRAEFLHEGLRWFDIRRFYIPLSRNSKNKLYTPLRKNDPRKTLQIPQEAIRLGLTPNPR